MNQPEKPATNPTPETKERRRARLAAQARVVHALLPFLPGPSFPDDEPEEEGDGG